MTRLTRFGRSVATAGAVAAMTVGLAGCSGSVPKDDVAKSIKVEVDKQNPGAGPVTCPADLKAEVGQSVRCAFEVDGQPVDAVATVTSIQGSTANYDIKAEARPVSKTLLERKIGEQVSQQAGVPVDSTECSGDLQPKKGESVTCTVKGAGETLPLKVEVTSVEGGLINYSANPA